MGREIAIIVRRDCLNGCTNVADEANLNCRASNETLSWEPTLLENLVCALRATFT